MSVRSDVGVCRACGSVELARDMVRLGAYLYACRGCAEAPASAQTPVRTPAPSKAPARKKAAAKESRAR